MATVMRLREPKALLNKKSNLAETNRLSQAWSWNKQRKEYPVTVSLLI